jgi:hypothetical protein
MSSILPLNLVDIDETKISLVYQGCGLNGVIRAFAAKASARDSTQFRIHQLNDSSQRVLVAAAPGTKKPGYFRGRLLNHRMAFVQKSP